MTTRNGHLQCGCKWLSCCCLRSYNPAKIACESETGSLCNAASFYDQAETSLKNSVDTDGSFRGHWATSVFCSDRVTCKRLHTNNKMRPAVITDDAGGFININCSIMIGGRTVLINFHHLVLYGWISRETYQIGHDDFPLP